MSFNDPIPQGKAVWLVCISTVADLINRPSTLNDTILFQNEVKRLAFESLQQRSEQNHLTQPYIAYYSRSLRNESYGGLRHTYRQETNMFALGKMIYVDLCLNHKSIEQVHFIAAESGAYVAIKVIEFIENYGTSLQWDFERLDAAWNTSIVTGDHPNKPIKENALSPLIKTVFLIHPSLPPLSGIVRILQCIRPHIYDYKKRKPLSHDGPSFLVKHGDRATEEIDVTPADSCDSIEEYLSILKNNVKKEGE